jgi:hypothetical protein
LILRSALSVAHVVVLPALPLALGCWLLVGEERARAATAAWFTISLVILAIGYFFARHFTSRSDGPALRLDHDGGRRYVLVLVSVAGFFTLLHFAADGIPVLSRSVETSRFEFGKSFFGIPGRMYLFGMPLATGAALARSRQLGLRWNKDRLTLIAISIFTVSRLLSGFKGGLLEVLIALTVAVVLVQGPVTSVAHVLRAYLPLAVAAVIGVFLVGSLYSTYQGHGRSLPDIILARATTNGALAGVLVFENRLLVSPDSSIDLDTKYFTKKYFSVGPGSPYAFGRLVASTIFHVGPESGAYTAPVTYGAFPEMAYDFGLPFALLGMFGLGALLALLEAIARRATLSGYIVCLATVLAIYDFANKGGLIYMCINWTVMTGLVLVATRLGVLVTMRHHSSSSRSHAAHTQPIVEQIQQPGV